MPVVDYSSKQKDAKMKDYLAKEAISAGFSLISVGVLLFQNFKNCDWRKIYNGGDETKLLRVLDSRLSMLENRLDSAEKNRFGVDLEKFDHTYFTPTVKQASIKHSNFFDVAVLLGASAHKLSLSVGETDAFALFFMKRVGMSSPKDEILPGDVTSIAAEFGGLRQRVSRTFGGNPGIENLQAIFSEAVENYALFGIPVERGVQDIICLNAMQAGN